MTLGPVDKVMQLARSLPVPLSVPIRRTARLRLLFLAGALLAFVALAISQLSVGADTAEIQRLLNAGGAIELPAGRFEVSGLRLPPDATLTGEGRGATVLVGVGSEPVISVTGSEQPTYLEVDHGPRIQGVSVVGDGGTGIQFRGVAYFSIEASEVRGFDVGVEFDGALQGRIDDVLFVGNRVGASFHPAESSYYTALSELPPNRVTVTWSTFYYSSFRAIDFRGGQQIIVRDSEFGMNGTRGDDDSAAIWVEGAGDPGGFGLVADGLWMESNRGRAAIVLRGDVGHVIRDSWFAYTNATFSIDAKGSELLCENIRHNDLRTVSRVIGCPVSTSQSVRPTETSCRALRWNRC